MVRAGELIAGGSRISPLGGPLERLEGVPAKWRAPSGAEALHARVDVSSAPGTDDESVRGFVTRLCLSPSLFFFGSTIYVNGYCFRSGKATAVL